MNDEYYIKFSDKTKTQLVIPANELNNDTTLTLFGRNTENWGELFGSSMLALLDNACNYYQPGWANQVLAGQLWYSTKDDTLKLCTNSNPLTWVSIANVTGSTLINVVTSTNIEQLTSQYISQTGTTTQMTGELILASVTRATPFYYLATKSYVRDVSSKFLRRKKTTANLRSTGDDVKTIIHLPNIFDSVDNCASKGYIDNLPNSIDQGIQTSVITCTAGGVVTDQNIIQTKINDVTLVNISGSITFKSGYKKCIVTLPVSYTGLYYCLVTGGIRPVDATNDVSSDIMFSVRRQNELVFKRKTTNINEDVYFIINGQYNSSAKVNVDEHITLTAVSAIGSEYTTYNQLTAILDGNGLPLSDINYEWYKASDLLNEVSNDVKYTPTTPGDYYVSATFVDGYDNTFTILSDVLTVAMSADRVGKIVINYSITDTKPYVPVLTAEIQDLDIPITPISYQWLFKTTDAGEYHILSDQTNESIKPVSSGIYNITVVYEDGSGRNNTINYKSVVPYNLTPLSFDAPGEVTITGFNGINFPLLATLTDLNRTVSSTAPIKYAWYKAGNLTAAIGTTQVYTPLSIGKYVCVITYTDSISADQTASSNDFEVFLTPSNIPGVVTISGAGLTGTQLSATLVDANRTDTSGAIEWQWYTVNDITGTRPTLIESATRSTFTPTEAGYYVAYATYNDAIHVGFNKEVAKSTPHQILVKFEGSAGVIKLTGKTQVNSVITAIISDVDVALSNFVWMWELKDANGDYQQLSGVGTATSPSCTYTPLVIGSYRVSVVYNDYYHTDTNTTNVELAVEVTPLDHDGVISISNTTTSTESDGTIVLISPLVGDTLEASITDEDVIDTTVAPVFQWYLDDPNSSPLLRSNTYIPLAAGIYYVKCSYTDSIGNHEVVQKVKVGNVDDELKIGDPYWGGFYAGDIYDQGLIYHLIVAPKSSEETNIDINELYVDTSVAVPIFEQTPEYERSAVNDWYIPTIYEALILYENFKPTTAANYKGRSVTATDTADSLFDNIVLPQINPYAIPPRWESYDIDGGPAQTKLTKWRAGGSEAFNTGAGAYLTKSDFIYFDSGLVHSSQSSSVQQVCIRRVAKYPKLAAVVSGMLEVNRTLHATTVGIRGATPAFCATIKYTWARVVSSNSYTILSDKREFTPKDKDNYKLFAAYNDPITNKPVKLVTNFTILNNNDIHGGGAYLGQFCDNNMVYRSIRSLDGQVSATNIPWISNVTQANKDKFGPVYFWNQPLSLNDTFGYPTTYLQSKYPQLNAARKVVELNRKSTTFKDWYLPTASEILFANIFSSDSSPNNKISSPLYKSTNNFNVFYGVPGKLADEVITDIWLNNSQFPIDTISDTAISSMSASQYDLLLRAKIAAANAAQQSNNVDGRVSPVTDGTTASSQFAPVAIGNFKYCQKYATVGVDVAGSTWYYDKRQVKDYTPKEDTAFVTAVDNFKVILGKVEVLVCDSDGDEWHTEIVIGPDYAAMDKARAPVYNAHQAWLSRQPDIASLNANGAQWTRVPWWSAMQFYPFRREIIYNTIGRITNPSATNQKWGKLFDGGFAVYEGCIVSLAHNGKITFAPNIRNLATDKQTAQQQIANLTTVANGKTYDDWVLPTKDQMLAMIGLGIEYAQTLAAWGNGGMAEIESPAIYWVADFAEPLMFATDDQVLGNFTNSNIITTPNTQVRIITQFDYKTSPYPAYARAIRK